MDEELSSDELEDIHICGVCKDKFYDINSFVTHKKVCKTKKSSDPNRKNAKKNQNISKKPKNSSNNRGNKGSNTKLSTEVSIAVNEDTDGKTDPSLHSVQTIISHGSDEPTSDGQTSESIASIVQNTDKSIGNKSPIVREVMIDPNIIHTMTSSMGTNILFSEVMVENGRKFKCQFNEMICRFETYYQKDLERHYRIHSGEKPYTCSYCGRSFNRSDKLKLHERSHTGEKPYKCGECPYSASDKSSLIKHQRIHTNERPFKCQICPYASRSSSQLVVHLRTHTGDAPFRCLSCPAAFKIHSDLKRHSTVHTGEKPYVCDQCEYRTGIKGNLRMHHKLNHSSESQVKCNECPFIAPSKKALKEHVRQHNAKSLHCDHCNYTSSSRSALNNHMRIHSNEKPYECIVCGYCCRQVCNLKTHIKKKHPGFDPNSDSNKDISKYKKTRIVRKSKAKTYCQTIFPCHLCDCSFVREDSLRSHIRHHKDIGQKTGTALTTGLTILGLQRENQSNEQDFESFEQNQEPIETNEEQTEPQEIELEVETSERSSTKNNENMVAVESRLYRRLMQTSGDSGNDHSYMRSTLTKSGQTRRGRPQKKSSTTSEDNQTLRLVPTVSGSVLYQLPNSMRFVSYVPIGQTDTGDTLLMIDSEALTSTAETVITDECDQ